MGTHKPIVIGISGSHGSGKTTLCHELVAELKKRHQNVGLVSGSARSSHYLIAGDKPPEMHLEIFCNQVVNEMRARRLHSVVICDRSIFDFVTYAKIRFDDHYRNRDNYFLNAMDAFIFDFKNNYDRLFVTSLSYGNPERDILRSRERVDAEQFDAKLREILTGVGVSAVSLPKEGKLDVVLATIEPLLASVAGGR